MLAATQGGPPSRLPAQVPAPNVPQLQNPSPGHYPPYPPPPNQTPAMQQPLYFQQPAMPPQPTPAAPPPMHVQVPPATPAQPAAPQFNLPDNIDPNQRVRVSRTCLALGVT